MNREQEKIEIPAKIIRGAMICQANNDVRKYLNGVAFNGETGEVSSSDGHMLFSSYVDALKGAFEGVRILNIPQKIPASIYDIIYDIESNQFMLLGINGETGVIFQCELVDGEFPNIKNVIQETAAKADGSRIDLNPLLFKRAINALEVPKGSGQLWQAKDGAVFISVPDELQRQVLIMELSMYEAHEH